MTEPRLNTTDTTEWRCSCGAPAFAVAPGDEGVRELFLLRREVPARAWCWRCWRNVFVEPAPDRAA
jgi:hypothetical protein